MEALTRFDTHTHKRKLIFVLCVCKKPFRIRIDTNTVTNSMNIFLCIPFQVPGPQSCSPLPAMEMYGVDFRKVRTVMILAMRCWCWWWYCHGEVSTPKGNKQKTRTTMCVYFLYIGTEQYL